MLRINQEVHDFEMDTFLQLLHPVIIHWEQKKNPS